MILQYIAFLFSPTVQAKSYMVSLFPFPIPFYILETSLSNHTDWDSKSIDPVKESTLVIDSAQLSW